jgi:DNA processing protein
VRLTLSLALDDASSGARPASLFGECDLPPQEKRIFALKADEANYIDEIVERLELGLSSPEIFVALFELELAGKVKQLPEKNLARCF